jgi:hypothetical protein
VRTRDIRSPSQCFRYGKHANSRCEGRAWRMRPSMGALDRSVIVPCNARSDSTFSAKVQSLQLSISLFSQQSRLVAREAPRPTELPSRKPPRWERRQPPDRRGDDVEAPRPIGLRLARRQPAGNRLRASSCGVRAGSPPSGSEQGEWLKGRGINLRKPIRN